MSIRQKPWEKGTPCWVDLMSTDPVTVHSFYSSVFGWQIEDTGSEFGHYGLARLEGKAVAGLGQAPEGMPLSFWTTYLATDDLASTISDAEKAGANVIAPAMEINGMCHMAMLADPTGAMVGLWQADPFIGAELVNQPGALVWNEQLSDDPATARAFYSSVFGRSFTAVDLGEGDYSTMDGDGPGEVSAGLGEPIGMPQGVPPHWLTYFAVSDAQVTAGLVAQHGGTVVKAPFETPAGTMAICQDPTGASFAVMSVDLEQLALLEGVKTEEAKEGLS